MMGSTKMVVPCRDSSVQYFDTSSACSSLNIRPVQTASKVKPSSRHTGSTPRIYSVVSITLKRP